MQIVLLRVVVTFGAVLGDTPYKTTKRAGTTKIERL